MQLSRRAGVKSINYLLILTILLQYVAFFASAFDLKRSLSFGGSDKTSHSETESTKPQEDHKYADDSLLTREAKANKVSKLLRFFHDKAGDAVYGKDGQPEGGASAEASTDSSSATLTDDQVISNACGEQTGRTCKYAVRAALREKPEDKKIIANALRHKPKDVSGRKVLYHKLFESAIAKTEELKIDEKIDFGINLIAKKNPYGWAAMKAVDMAM